MTEYLFYLWVSSCLCYSAIKFGKMGYRQKPIMKNNIEKYVSEAYHIVLFPIVGLMIAVSYIAYFLGSVMSPDKKSEEKEN